MYFGVRNNSGRRRGASRRLITFPKRRGKKTLEPDKEDRSAGRDGGGLRGRNYKDRTGQKFLSKSICVGERLNDLREGLIKSKKNRCEGKLLMKKKIKWARTNQMRETLGVKTGWKKSQPRERCFGGSLIQQTGKTRAVTVEQGKERKRNASRTLARPKKQRKEKNLRKSVAKGTKKRTRNA